MSRPYSCVYCGWPCARVWDGDRVLVLKTCAAHTGLPALDPAYGLAETLARETYPALSLEDTAPSALRKETRV